MAMGALGSDAAIEAADVVLMDDDPAKIALAMKISKRTLEIVRENIIFALAIKAICLVLGALGIANMWVRNICRRRCNGTCGAECNKSIKNKIVE